MPCSDYVCALSLHNDAHCYSATIMPMANFDTNEPTSAHIRAVGRGNKKNSKN